MKFFKWLADWIVVPFVGYDEVIVTFEVRDGDRLSYVDYKYRRQPGTENYIPIEE